MRIPGGIQLCRPSTANRSRSRGCEWSRDLGSFRDPSGFVFSCDGVVYRQVNASFGESYRRLMKPGLHDELVADRLIVAHEEVPLRLPDTPPALAVLRPEQGPFISYPYEWCFSQLKAAALLTLDLQRRSFARGMMLRDASAYNVQFLGSQPIFIDTLSFGDWTEGQPWAAYRQFCQHFLAPLALMAYASILPLIQNLANPSPAAGWSNTERRSLLERGPADLVMALALVHHLAIGGNVPLQSLAAFFERIGRWLIIEFVPREDSQVQRMLALREDVFGSYTKEAFERAFGERFRFVRSVEIEGTVRTLYLMERR